MKPSGDFTCALTAARKRSRRAAPGSKPQPGGGTGSQTCAAVKIGAWVRNSVCRSSLGKNYEESFPLRKVV